MSINREKVEAAAIKLLQAGKLDKAVLELKKLVEDDKNDVRTLLKLGDTYVKMGNKREAVESYSRAATIYTEQGFFLKAVAVYKQVLRVDNNLPDLHLKLAELYQQLGLQSDAMSHYQSVATAFEQAGRAREAVDMLKRMVDLEPDNLALRIKLGELYANEEMAAEAVQELRRALTFLKNQQRLDDYLRVGEKLVAYDATALDVTRELANIYIQRKQPSQALTKLQVCFRAEPRNLELLTLIAQAFLDTKQTGKTVSVYKEMARIHGSDGDKAQARALWEKVLALAPTDAEAKSALGLATVAKAPIPTPEKKAPARPPPEVELLQRLMTEADVYVKYGLKDKAIEHLEKVFAVRVDHIPALEKLKGLTQGMRGRAHLEALQRLVAAAEAQGHARLNAWKQELVKAEAAAALADDDDEHEDLVIDDDGVAFDEDSGIVHLGPNSSGVFPLDRSDMEDAPVDDPTVEVSQRAGADAMTRPGVVSAIAAATHRPGLTQTTTSPSAAGQLTDGIASMLEGRPVEAAQMVPGPGTRLSMPGSQPPTKNWDNDPATVGFSEELTEAEYFLRRGMLDKARELLVTVQSDAPDSARVAWMLERVSAREAGKPEPLPPWEQPVSGKFFSSPPTVQAPEAAPASVGDMLADIKTGVGDAASAEDGATHYELGVAYREMGLFDDAIAELQLAARAPSHVVDARFMMGMVRAAQGQREQAVALFDEALAAKSVTAVQRGALHYERGIVLEELGRNADALEAYRAAKAANHGASELDRRIKAMTEGARSSGVASSGGSASSAGRGSKNIDYA